MSKPLEHKVVTLEKRLAVVERFLQLRYCESFQDFSFRNSGNQQNNSAPGGSPRNRVDIFTSSNVPEEDETSSASVIDADDGSHDDSIDSDDDPEPESVPRVSSRGRVIKPKKSASGQKSLVTPSKSRKSGNDLVATGKVKECSVKIDRITTSAKYNTRRQGKASGTTPVKEELVTNDSNDNENPGDSSMMDADNDYFTFPDDVEADSDNGVDPLIADDSLIEPEVKRTREKRNKTRRPYKRKSATHYLTSVSSLSEESKQKLLSMDPTRAECPICGRLWKKDRLHQHIESHTKERNLKCDQCDKSYFSVDQLRVHKKVAHEGKEGFPKCRLCQKPVLKKRAIFHEKVCVLKALRNEQNVGQDLIQDIREKCAEAGLEFSLPDEHVPPGVDPTEKLECPKCFRFFQRRYYDKHVQMHSLERNWKCGKCPKSYIHKHDLVRHMCTVHDKTAKIVVRTTGGTPQPNLTEEEEEDPSMPIVDKSEGGGEGTLKNDGNV